MSESIREQLELAHDDRTDSTEPMTVRAAAEGAAIVGVEGYDLVDVDGGILVFEPTTEYREHLGREVRTGRRLVGLADVTDRLALREELARRGLGVGAAHNLETYELEEIDR